MSDAVVVILSRTDLVSDKKVDLPSAWRERAKDAYWALFACLALLTVYGLTGATVEFCFTHTWEDNGGSFCNPPREGCTFEKYTLSLCPRLREVIPSSETRTEFRDEYGLFANASSVWRDQSEWDSYQCP